MIVMPQVRFTQNIQRHVACPSRSVNGTTLREVLDRYFSDHPTARGYVLDDEVRYPAHGKVVEPIANRSPESSMSSQVPENEVVGVNLRRALGEVRETLAAVVSLWVTEDGGDSWKTVSSNLPPVYCVRFEKSI